MRIKNHFIFFLCLINLSFASAQTDGNKYLHDAMKNGRVEEVRKFLSNSKNDINDRIFGGYTPLEAAVDWNQPEILELLIKKGASVNTEDAEHLTPLYRAIFRGNKEVIEILIVNGANVNVVVNYTDCMLCLAARLGNVEVADLLIRKGLNVNFRNAYGQSPLHKASDNGQIAMTKFLLSNGAEVDAKDSAKRTPLMVADNFDVASILVDSGADVNSYSNSGEMPLFHAVSTKNIRTVELLLSKGADSNKYRDQSGSTALMYAALVGATDIAKKLIEAGADVNAIDNNGQTPLLKVANMRKVNPAILSVLLDHGADINAQDRRGFTFLHYIASHVVENGKEAATIAIARGANVQAKIKAEKFSDSMEGYTPLQLIALTGQAEIGALLIANNANVNELTKDQLTPMDIAIIHNNVATARLLLEHGADIKTNSGRDAGSPLHHAVQAGNLEITSMLIAKGADLNAPDASGMSPLHLAVKNGHQELTQLLLVHGADVNAVDNNGLSPIRLASPPITAMLVAKGAIVPAKASSTVRQKICGLVVSNANRNALGDMMNASPYEENLTHLPEQGWEDETLGNVDQRFGLLGNDSQYVVGMSEDHPIYVSHVSDDHIEELICQIGHKENPQGYYVRTKAEVAVRRYLREDRAEEVDITEFPAEIPKDIAVGSEIHVVSGYEVEAKQSNGTVASVVNVLIDRPGKKVMLVLNGYRFIEWHVTASSGTQITGILLASLSNDERSNSTTQPIAVAPARKSMRDSKSTEQVKAAAPVYRVSIPYALYKLNSPEFGNLMQQLNGWSGRRKIDSFYGTYALPNVISINQADANAQQLSMDFPHVQSAAEKITFDLYDQSLRPISWTLAGPVAKESHGVTYLGTGRFAVAPNGKEAYFLYRDQFILFNLKTGVSSRFALPSNFPAFSWASALAYDTRRNVVSVASFGGEGYFYRFDVKSRRWLDYHSFKNIDTLSLAYDKSLDRYVAWTTDGQLLSIAATGEISEPRPCATLLPGFDRIYPQDHEYEHKIELRPKGRNIAIAYISRNIVFGIWEFNFDTKLAKLTYKVKSRER